VPKNGDIEFSTGDDCKFGVRWRHDGVPVDISGYTAELKARTHLDAPEAALELSTNDGIILDAAKSIAFVVISRDLSVSLKGRYTWDLVMIAPDGTETMVRRGGFMFRLRNTRPNQP